MHFVGKSLLSGPKVHPNGCGFATVIGKHQRRPCSPWHTSCMHILKAAGIWCCPGWVGVVESEGRIVERKVSVTEAPYPAFLASTGAVVAEA